MSALTFAVLICVGFVIYTYGGYPLLLWLLARRRPAPVTPAEPPEWPRISISLPVFNGEATIRRTLDALLAVDYPMDRRQIVVISDASTDATDAIVQEYADRGVRLVRLGKRSGKTAAEAAALPSLSGDIVINTDATIRMAPDALKRLVRHFSDATVGVASGRDVSTSATAGDALKGEGEYVGYDMAVRSLETRLGTIVGASGCCYAIRRPLHGVFLPPNLSRDFASALVAREHGLRAVSVDDALCYVPRQTSLRGEYRRKVRTITRGIQTLWFKRHLLNPSSGLQFAWMLASHKICRWLAPWFALAAMLFAAALVLPAALFLGMLAVAVPLVVLAVRLGSRLKSRPRWVTTCAYLVLGNVAAMHALVRALADRNDPVWEPTRREATAATAPALEPAVEDVHGLLNH